MWWQCWACKSGKGSWLGVGMVTVGVAEGDGVDGEGAMVLPSSSCCYYRNC